MDRLILKPGREKSLLRRHPWVFSGAIQKVEGQPGSGDSVEIVSSKEEILGIAAYSPTSSIRARMWAYGEVDEKDLADIISGRLRIAIDNRRYLIQEQSGDTAQRLVYAESDGLPGFVADRYGEWLVVQVLSASAEKWRDFIVEQVSAITGLMNVYERSDVDVRELESLPERAGVLLGDEPPETIEILENGLKFLVDIRHGHKTGFYLDQRDNRAAVQKYVKDKKVLNCFSYTGGFTVSALAAGAAQVTSIDSSADVLEMGKQNLALNGLPADKTEWICADVFKELRAMRDRRESFDMIILDPPKFAPTAAQVRSAARGYKDINLLAFKLLNPGGILVTFSCSGGVDRALFQKIVADAALDAGVDAQILEYLSQAPDHPIALNFPEGEYLKGLICRIG